MLQAERVLDHLFRDVGWKITYEWRIDGRKMAAVYDASQRK